MSIYNAIQCLNADVEVVEVGVPGLRTDRSYTFMMNAVSPSKVEIPKEAAFIYAIDIGKFCGIITEEGSSKYLNIVAGDKQGGGITTCSGTIIYYNGRSFKEKKFSIEVNLSQAGGDGHHYARDGVTNNFTTNSNLIVTTSKYLLMLPYAEGVTSTVSGLNIGFNLTPKSPIKASRLGSGRCIIPLGTESLTT